MIFFWSLFVIGSILNVIGVHIGNFTCFLIGTGLICLFFIFVMIGEHFYEKKHPEMWTWWGWPL